MSKNRLKGINTKTISKTLFGFFGSYQSSTKGGNGLTYHSAGTSAQQLKNDYGYNTDGVYWIDLPIVGPTQIYCIMNSAIDGGGWMMAMKATTGNTFNYTAKHWTNVSTLNHTDISRNNADAKYHTMNYFQGKDLLALWPDIGQGGSVSVSGYPWTWLENNFYDGNRTTMINFFGLTYANTNGGSGKFIKDAKTFSGWASGVFSSQVDVRFYGFNYQPDPTYGSLMKARWGFGWNENGEGLYPGANVQYKGTNDVSGGIGLSTNVSYSAGDYIACCQDTTGINRSARVEVYVR